VLADLVGGEVVDVGFASFDELQSPLVELAEVVGGVAEAVPLEAEPADVGLDGIDVLLLFFFRVGVVEAQVGLAAELVGEAEVDADGLGVADVEVAVGLGGKAGLDLGVAVLFGAHILGDDVAEEVGGGKTENMAEGFLRQAWRMRAKAADRGRGRPWFQRAAARFCVRRRRRGWAGRHARPSNQVARLLLEEPGRANRDRS
jgi:hypothetical protein